MTSPVAGLPLFDDNSPNTPWLHFETYARKLDGQVVPNFATTTERNTAYAAFVTAGGTMRAGKLCSVNGLIYRSTGTSTSAWELLVPDGPGIITRNTAPSSTISSGGANQTGLTSGIAALSDFTLTKSGTVAFTAVFRGGGDGAMLCTLLINGAQVGDVGITRSDVTTTVVGAVALAAGSHAIALRAEASGGSVVWDRARVIGVMGAAA